MVNIYLSGDGRYVSVGPDNDLARAIPEILRSIMVFIAQSLGDAR